MKSLKTIDVWSYYDGILEGVLTKANGIQFYFRMREDQDMNKPRVYDAWLVLAPPDPNKLPTRKADSVLHEQDMDTYEKFF